MTTNLIAEQPPAQENVRKQEGASPLYRPELDMLRFFAFLLVFLNHGSGINIQHGHFGHHLFLARGLAFITQIGGFGLSLFFFLSSFLITSLLIQEREKTGTIHLRAFYARRILRIWPLYLTYLAFAFVLGHFWAPAYFPIPALLAFLFMSANWYILAAGQLGPVTGYLWSISVEEQFYLLWPILVQRFGPRGIRNFCLGVFGAAVVCAGALARHGVMSPELWFNSAVQMIFFAGGGLLALHLGLRSQAKSVPRAVAGICVGILLWFGARLLVPPNDFFGPFRAMVLFPLIVAGCASLLWGFLHLPPRFIHPRLVYLGRISYGLYVFHGLALMLGIQFGRPHIPLHAWTIASFALTLLLAACSYRWLEKPFLRLKYRFELVHSRRT